MLRSAFPRFAWLFGVLFVVLTGSRLCGAVQIIDSRIVKGSSFCVPTDGTAIFRCTIHNPDAESHRVRLRILPPGENVNNPEVFVPAKSKVTMRVPVYVNRWEKYTFDVFQDGRQLPGSVLNECTVQLPESTAESIAFLNNTGDTIGGMNKNVHLPHRLVPIMHRAEDLPESWREYDRLRMLVICTPNFEVCTSAQFAALIEYVAQGGTMVFVNPKGLLAAASTPLAELLPVRPLRIRKVSHLEGIENLVGGNAFKGLGEGREIDFVDSVETASDSGVTFARHEGFPIMREHRYGLGTVRVLAIFPNRSTFPNSGEFADRLIARVLATPYCQPSYQAFKKPLDHLTGFSIPGVGLVELLLGGYFVLLAILFIGFKKLGHGGWCWSGSVILALLGTVGILMYAGRTLGSRGSLMAEVRVENETAPDNGMSFVSMYAPKAGKSSFSGENRRSLLGDIPRNPAKIKDRFTMQHSSMSPLDVRVGADGRMVIRDLNFNARTSRQYVEFRSGACQAGGTKSGFAAPRLLLSSKGLALESWQLPEGLRDCEAFMLFPNGSRLVAVDSEGNCTMEKSTSMLTDPFMMDLREAMERSCSKVHPALVVVAPVEAGKRELADQVTLQGKRLLVYPAELVPTEATVRIPSEMLVLSPDHAVSALMFEGNRIASNHSFMGDFYARISVMLPTSLAQLQPSGLRLRLRTSNTERIQPVVKFLLGGDEKRVSQGTADETGAYVFPAESLSEIINRETLAGTLMVEGKIKPNGEKEQDFSANNWSILDLGITVEGTLPETLVRKSL